MGDQVTAYDPATGKSSTQTVQHVWVNHDNDLLDVTLHEDGQATEASSGNKTIATDAWGARLSSALGLWDYGSPVPSWSAWG